MKSFKTTIIVMFVLFVAGISVLFGVTQSNSDYKGSDNKEKSKSSYSYSKTTSSTTSNNAADYLPSPYRAMQLLKNYFSQQGVSFDSWTLESNSESNYKLINYAGGVGAIIINNDELIFTIDSYNQIIYSKSSGYSTVLKFYNFNCYDVLNVLLSDVPYSLRPTLSELKELERSIIPPGQKDLRKNGINYSVLIGNDGTTVIMFSL